MLSEKETKTLDEILEKFDNDASRVIGIMQEIQKVYRYLPEESLTYISKALNISEAKIFGVATFYENFSLNPRASTSLRFATELPATCVIPCRFLKSSERNLTFPIKRRPPTTVYLPLKPFPASAHADLHRFVPLTIPCILP